MLMNKIIYVLLFVVALSLIGVSHASPSNLTVIGKAGLYIFGVTQEPNGTMVGVPAMLNLTVTKGTGQIYIGSTPLTGTDTQAQAVISTDVACRLLNVNCNQYNFYYFITSFSPEVSGPSAGGAFTIAAMSILSGKPLNPNVAMTGTANPDGSVGIVGDVSEKSEAAALQGIKIFLYPSTDNVSSSAESFDQARGMETIPISTIDQAFEYFTGYSVYQPLNSSIYTPFYNAVMNRTYYVISSYQTQLYDSLPSVTPSNQTAEYYITTAQNAITRERSLYSEGDAYDAASLAINTSIPDLVMARVIESSGGNLQSYLSSLINQEYGQISSTYNNVTQDYVTNSSDLDLKLIAVDRLAQASYLLNASNSSLSSNLSQALYYYALANTKRVSAVFWVSILPRGHVSFSQDSFYNYSSYYLYKASSYADYSALLGVNSPDQISLMNYYLNKANNYYNEGQYIPSIFDSIEALGVSQLIIEENSVINGSFAPINSQLANMALASIDNAERAGVTPFLGISYYQYAQSFSPDTGEAYLIQFYANSMLYSEFEEDLVSGATLKSVALVPSSAPVQNVYTFQPGDAYILYFLFIVSLIIIALKLISENRFHPVSKNKKTRHQKH